MNERKEHGNNSPGTHLPETSLLICSRNRPELLWDTLQSILQGYEVPTEIIVVDQSETPNQILASFRPERQTKFQYLWSEKKGVSNGRNLAIAAATYPILVLTDDDMLMAPTWFGSIVRALLAIGPRGVVTGQVLSSKEDEEGFAPSTREDQETVTYQGRVNRDVLSTGNMCIYRSAFNAVGNFDMRLGPGTVYPAAEDNDFAFRLLENNFCIVYEPRASVYHRDWRSPEESLLLHWHYGCGQGAFYAKYFSIKDTYMIRRMVRNVSGYLVRVPYRLLRQRHQAYRDFLYVLGLLYGAVRWQITT